MRRWRLAASILAAATVLGACSSEPELEPISMPRLPFLTWAPITIADVEGWFAEEGLEVTYVDATSALPLVPAVVSGELDVWAGAVTYGLFNAMASGEADLRIVAGKGELAAGEDGCAASGIITGPDGNADLDASLAGASIASRNGSMISDWIRHAFVTAAGIDDGDLEIVDVSVPAVPEALATGQVDLAHASEPWITRTEGAQVVAAAHDLAPGYPQGVVVFGSRLLNDAPEVGDRFMRAYLRGLEQYNLGKTEENLDLLSTALDIDRDLLARMCWTPMPADGSVDRGALTEAIDWSVANGDIEAPLSEDDWWSGDWLDRAGS